MSQYQVSEIFCSLQGEGPTAGLPTTFVRLVGCPLRCRWCDTEYAFTGGNRQSLTQIVEQVRKAGLPGLCLTGGEPLAHKAAPELLSVLESEFPTVDISIETSGAFVTAGLPRRIRRILDWKAPSSGEEGTFKLANLDDLGSRDAIKFVINGSDFSWFEQLYEDHKLGMHSCDLLLHGIHGEMNLQELAQWMVDRRFRARLGLQLHKVIWPHITRGV